MTAATLRRPARWRDAVRAEFVVLQGTFAILWFALVPLMMLQAARHAASLTSTEPFDDPRMLAWLMFFFPLAWRGEGGRERTDTPLPMRDVQRELIRIAFRAALAALLLGAAIGGYSWVLGWIVHTPGTIGGFPLWYPAALFLVGMGNVLLGTAVMLRAERPGRALLTAFLVGMMMLAFLGTGVETAGHTIETRPDGGQTWTGTTSLTVGSAALYLALGLAALCASVAAGHARALPRLHWFRCRTLTPLAAPPRRHASRVPASLARIAARQFALLAPRMVWPMLMAALVAQRQYEAGREIQHFATDSGPFQIWVHVSLCWPFLVWMDERRPGDWDDARPAGIFARRLLHAWAGLAWLWLTMGLVLAGRLAGFLTAGTLAPPDFLPGWIFPGVPLAVLAMYCLGSLWAVFSTHPVIHGLLAFSTLGFATLLLHPDGDLEPAPLSPERVLAPLGWVDERYWSGPVAASWTFVFVLALVGVIRLRVRRDRDGRLYDPARIPVLGKLLRGEAA